MTRVFRESDYPLIPWKNGQGVTRDIYRINQGDEWFFRITSADLTASGPFSDYSGFDRTLVNLGPGKIHLQSVTSGSKELAVHAVHHFDGGVTTLCEISEKGRDLNVFCKRGRYFASTIVRNLTGPEFIPLPPTSGTVVFVCRGALVVHNNQRREFYLDRGDSIVREPSDALNPDRWMLAKASEDPCIFVAIVFHAIPKDV